MHELLVACVCLRRPQEARQNLELWQLNGLISWSGIRLRHREQLNSFLLCDAELSQRFRYSALAIVEPSRLNRKSNLLEIPRRTVSRVQNDLPAFKALLCQERWR